MDRKIWGTQIRSGDVYVKTVNVWLLQALDFVVAEARKHGVRLLLTLVNNLPEYGGKSRYVQWARDNGDDLDRGSDDHFFTHPKIRDYYKAHVKV